MATEANKDKFRKALAASTDKYVKQQGRNTIALNATRDPACAGYARVPGPDACDFCVTMGARDDFYHTEESAGGGAGHGSKDDLYHPYCNCQIVMIFRRRGELVARDPETGGIVPYDGKDLLDRYQEAGRPTFAKNRVREAERRRARRRNGEVPSGGSYSRNPYNGAMLSDVELDAAMKSLADAGSLDELHEAGRAIVDSWQKNAAGRNKAQWDKISRFAKDREKQLLATVERERAYGVRYEDAMVVEGELLESRVFISKFDGISDDAQMNEKILEGARHALTRNSGKNTESLTLIDSVSFDTVTVDCDISYGIEYSDEIRAFIAERKDGPSVIVAVHNHPNGMPPSLDDFSKAAENNYLLGVAVGHNGQVYVYKNYGKIYSLKECESVNDLVYMQVHYFGRDVDRVCAEIYKERELSYEVK